MHMVGDLKIFDCYSNRAERSMFIISIAFQFVSIRPLKKANKLVHCRNKIRYLPF